jgi:predicted transcriptional regulator
MADPAPLPRQGLFGPAEASDEERALLEAEANFAAGRIVSHEAMMRWLKSWGTSGELPPPADGD